MFGFIGSSTEDDSRSRASTQIAANQWHTLGLRADGDRFTVWFDGNALFTAEDKTFADPGNVALWTKSDSVTHFDTISMLTMSLGSNEKRTPGSSCGNF